jgi:DNA-directed RNA polymerase specialized sigma subunit
MKDLGLIQKIAYSFHAATGLEISDLIQEGAYAYLKASKKYNPEKAKFSTYIWNCISLHLINYIHSVNPNVKKGISLVSIDSVQYDKNFLPRYLFESLNKDAQIVAEIVLSHPAQFYRLTQTEAKKLIFHILKNTGWETYRIHFAMDSIKLALK